MTLLIKNVHILGGARDFPEKSDVFVSGDKISAIGNFPNKAADQSLDGQGAYLAPGFIDVNTDSDHYLTLFDHPSQDDFLSQGVTTIFGGMCGASLAPLLYGSLESLRKWGDPDRINVNWHTTAEFLQVLDKRPLGVNFGTLAGHATIRRAILGDALRDLTKNELDVFKETLRIALREGAFGLSTGLGYVHARNTPYAELNALARVVKEVDAAYATHLRHIDVGIKESVMETIKLAKEAGVKTLVSHFVPLARHEAEYEAALDLLEGLPDETNIRFDIYPSQSTLLPVYTFLPLWVQTGGLEVMLANVTDEWLLPRIKKDMPRVDPRNFVVAQSPGNEYLVGKNLDDIKEMYGVGDERDAIVKLMAAMQMRGTILYKSIDKKLMTRSLASRRSFIASNAPSFSTNGGQGKQLKTERTTATFTTFLSLAQGDGAGNNGFLPLADAVRKITKEPAQFFGLVGRGEIKEGNYADLACFRGSDVKFTIVNGAVAWSDGVFREKFAGRALRRSAQKK